MGHRALLSYEQSENHKNNVKSMKVQPPMNAFFKKSENSAKGSSENQSSSNAASCSNKQQQSLDMFVTQDEVTRTELLWVMNVSTNISHTDPAVILFLCFSRCLQTVILLVK